MNFQAYCAALARYVSRATVTAHYSEVLAMFRCGVSPMGAAAHLILSFNR